MIRKITIACLITFVVSASGIAFANDIYKWTDADGNVHYGDRPTANATEERLAISSGPTNPSRVQARIQARHAASKSAEVAAASEPKGPTKDELRAQAEERRQTNQGHSNMRNSTPDSRIQEHSGALAKSLRNPEFTPEFHEM